MVQELNGIVYYEIKQPENWFIARWLKKPSNKDWRKSIKMVRGYKRSDPNYKVTIGIVQTLVTRINDSFENQKKDNNMYGQKKEDINDIAQHMCLPMSLIKVVLEMEGKLK